MAADAIRVRARRERQELGLSMESVSYLVEDRPPGGWDSLVTKDEFRRDLEKLELGIRAELHKEIREQTRWFATLVIGAMTVSVAATALIGAALRFA